MRDKLLVAALLGLIALGAAIVTPPRSAADAVFAQLRLPISAAARGAARRTVLLSRSVREIPTARRLRKTSRLYKGQRRLQSSGRPGAALTERPVRIGSDGLARTLAERRIVLRRPTPATVLVGTAQGHLLLRGGVMYRYSRRLTLTATAYNASYAQNGPWGATARLGGVPLTKGMVAVDPRVIPLGTRLYVQGYGPALAADTGSAIQGDRIDLFFNLDAQQTANFGIRRLSVYILDPHGS